MRRQHELAKLRRRGKGVWIVEFAVIGEDNDFVMYAPGEWDQERARIFTGVALANQLRVKYPEHIIFKNINMEPP